MCFKNCLLYEQRFNYSMFFQYFCFVLLRLYASFSVYFYKKKILYNANCAICVLSDSNNGNFLNSKVHIEYKNNCYKDYLKEAISLCIVVCVCVLYFM